MLSPEKQKMVDAYNKGLALYQEKNFVQALPFFQEALQIAPTDGPSKKFYIERCQELIKNPPPADWDGVFIMKTK